MKKSYNALKAASPAAHGGGVIRRARLTLGGQLRRHAAERPNAPVYVLASTGEELSFGELDRAVEALAKSVRAAVWPAGVVILSCSNQLQYPVAFLAILRAGYSVFPISPQAADTELRRAAAESGAVGVIGDERAVSAIGATMRFALPINRIPLRAAQATASLPTSIAQPLGDLLLQSSGTTGLPKIVRRTGYSLDAAAWAVVESVGFEADDRVLMTIPLTHSYGLEHGLLTPIWAGSCVHLLESLELPVVLATLRDKRITILPGVPSTFEMLSRVPATSNAIAPALRRAYSAGAAPAGSWHRIHSTIRREGHPTLWSL